MSYANYPEHRMRPAPTVPFSEFTQPVQSIGQGVVTAFETAGGAVAAVAARIARKVHEHRSIGRLSALDDRTLRDIGVARSEIRYLARRVSEHPGLDYRATSQR